jgi:hypothetical protein
MPVDRSGVAATDSMDQPIQRHDRNRAATATLQWLDGAPTIAGDIIGVTIRHGYAVLFDKPSEGIDYAARSGDADVVGAARNRSSLGPSVTLGGIDMVIGAGHLLLAVAADEMHSVIFCGRPSHFAARNRQRRRLRPPALRIGPGCG